MRFDELAATIRQRIDFYRRTGDTRILFADDVRSDVRGLVGAAQPLDPDHPSPAELERLDTSRQLLGTLFFLRFDSAPFPQGDLTDLAQAIGFCWPTDSTSARGLPQTLRALLPGPGADVISQVGAAVALFRHALSAADPISIRVTLVLLESVVAATPARHREFSLRTGYLVSANLAYYRLTEDLRAADEAIELSERCLDALPRRHRDRAWFLAAIASARTARLRHGSLGDLKHVIQTGELALSSRERRFRLRRMKRHRSGDPFLEALADLAFAYELSPFRTQLMLDLAAAYELRYGYSRGPEDLDRAIALRERAAAELKTGNPDLLSGIANGHLVRYDRTGQVRDLRRAVAAAERFTAVAGPGHPFHPLVAAIAALARLLPKGGQPGPHPVPAPRPGGGFLKRLWLARIAPLAADDTDDTDTVITLGEHAIGMPGLLFALDETVTVPDKDDPATDRTVIALSDLYAARFARFGDKTDIDRAVALVEQLASLDTVDDLGKAAWAFKLRFTASRSTEDLDIAVSLYEKAFEETASGDHPARGWVTHELADAYRAKARSSGEADLLRRAAELSEQLLAETPPDDPARAPRMAAVGDTHLDRFRICGDVAELDRAIELYRQANTIEPTPITPAKLATTYHARFLALGDVPDLRLAIEYYAEAQSRNPDDSLRTMCVAGYCAAYRRLFDAAPREVSTEDLETLAEACTGPMRGEPRYRAQACHAVGSLALAMNWPHLAVRVLDQAVDLLRTAAWRDTGWPDQEAQLGEARHLADESIAAHLAAGDPAGAVEAAERSRALILGSELDIRGDMADLASSVPELADRLGRVRERLTTPMVVDFVGDIHDNVGRNNRVQLWAEHDHLVSAARQLPGFAGFLRPPGLPELRPAVEDGAVVLVTATGSRGDAIIVTSDADPIPVALPRLTSADIQAHARALLEATSASPLTRALRAPRVLTGILGWLWESVVEPVLSALSEAQREPRIWWLPTGTLGLLPLHAAGAAGRPGALDLAVSSYIPTLRALQHARRRVRPAERRQLTVALEHTPGFPRLPGTTAEAATLHARHPAHPLLTGTDATANAVAHALSECTWAHFACHATTDPNTSSRAALHLYGSELSVETISRLHLEAAELAYLSACSTAGRGLHADEPVNLASAFHLAGFRHVVATLWHLSDTAAAHAAQAFYETLGEASSADGAAGAVRAVARGLRAEHPHRPDLWAALIHSGP